MEHQIMVGGKLLEELSREDLIIFSRDLVGRFELVSSQHDRRVRQLTEETQKLKDTIESLRATIVTVTEGSKP